MEIEACLKIKKEIYSSLLTFLETTDDSNSFNQFLKVIQKHKIQESKIEVLDLIQLISKIEDNHHRNSNFYDKIEQILRYFIKNHKTQITSFEIYEIFQNNKRILLLLLEKMLFNDEKMIPRLFLNEKYRLFLYPGLKKYITEANLRSIENEITKINNSFDELSTFEENCIRGENEAYICSLIREDSIEDFIVYITQKSLSLTSTINESIFETNLFLMNKQPSLIEYAAFFGSMKIIRYLTINGVDLEESLWLYAIHSNNPLMIHFLEEKNVEPKNKQYDEILIESIKCHHNDITNYIRDSLLTQSNSDIDYKNENDMSAYFDSYIINSLNYYYLPNKIDHLISKNKNNYSFSKIAFSLTKITIPSSVTSIGNDTFLNCSLLKQVSIPDSIVRIGSKAFANCSSLSEISIPLSITEIEDDMFTGCSSLTEIIIPPSVTKIGNNAFSGCSSLTKITISSSVVSIGQNIFNGVKTLEILGDKNCIHDHLFDNCGSLKQITIPSTVKSIGEYSFNHCSSLNKIDIPSSIEKIGRNAFSYCCSLTEITIPSSVTKIEESTFFCCNLLSKITIPSSVTSIGKNAFGLCLLLKQIELPPCVTSIENDTFNGCSALEHVLIPSSVKHIGENAFTLCSELKQINIPSSVTSISENAFSLCSMLNQISIPSSLDIKSIGIDSNVKVIKT